MSDYSDYKLTGSVLSDRDTVNRAINDPNLSSSEKNDIIREHNLHNLDFVSYVPDTTQHDSGGDPGQKTINSLNSAKLVIEKRYDAAFIDDCQGEEAHQSEPDNRRYSAHACRR